MKLGEWLKKKLKLETLHVHSLHKLTLSKKTVVNLVVLLCIGITFILVADFYKDLKTENSLFPTKQTDASEQTIDENDASSGIYVKDMEKQLAVILSKIQNAGKVSVMITLKGSSEIIPAKDEAVSDKVTNEKDTEGGTRTINELNTNDKVVFQNIQGGLSKPLIVKEINPEIKGVIVVAEGARDPRVKLRLSQAVQTVLDIPAYRITVYEGQ